MWEPLRSSSFSVRDPLAAVIDPVTSAFGLHIAGLKTPSHEGTLGFYFRSGDDLYAVTARHVLLPEDEGNEPYTYTGMYLPEQMNPVLTSICTGGVKKEVILMGYNSYSSFFKSILRRIGALNRYILSREKQEATALAGAPNARKLSEVQTELKNFGAEVEVLKNFYERIQQEKWEWPKNRVIGHVVWAPAISVIAARRLRSAANRL